MRKIQLILAAAALVGSNGLNAQTKPKTDKDAKVYKPSEERCISSDGEKTCTFFRFHEDSSLIKRAAIGVQIEQTGTKRDTIGVFIARVVPDGPAEKAGIVEGERIVSINGIDLRVSAADVDDSYTAGLASHRLTREIEKLTPGAVVRLQVNSGGRTREVQVTTMRASEIQKLNGSFGFSFPRTPFMQGMTVMPAVPNMKIMRENMEQMRIRALDGKKLSPTRIRVITPKVPMHFNNDDDFVYEGTPMPAMAPMPAFAPLPGNPGVPKAVGRFRSSI
jgi:hypothetical protein